MARAGSTGSAQSWQAPVIIDLGRHRSPSYSFSCSCSCSPQQ